MPFPYHDRPPGSDPLTLRIDDAGCLYELRNRNGHLQYRGTEAGCKQALQNLEHPLGYRIVPYRILEKAA